MIAQRDEPVSFRAVRGVDGDVVFVDGDVEVPGTGRHPVDGAMDGEDLRVFLDVDGHAVNCSLASGPGEVGVSLGALVDLEDFGHAFHPTPAGAVDVPSAPIPGQAVPLAPAAQPGDHAVERLLGRRLE